METVTFELRPEQRAKVPIRASGTFQVRAEQAQRL